MKKIYTHENRFLVHNAKNLVAQQGIEVMLKNEFAGGGLGELAAFDTWLELWVMNDDDYSRACEIIDSALSAKDTAPWQCPACDETNDASFEVCCQCGADKNPA